MSNVATRADWKILPMPAQRARLELDLTFDDTEFQKLAAGLVPKEMEDKWFIYFERPWLHLHRSWTGFCVYQVRFESDGGRHRVIEAIANRNPEQYRTQSEAQDVLLLTVLLLNRVGHDSQALWKKYQAGLSPASRA
jgi:hypothetical protein